MGVVGGVQQVASPALDAVMLAVSYIGDAEGYIVLLAVLYLAVDPALARRVGVYLLCSAYLNSVIKLAVDTPRPFELRPELARSEAAVATAGGASFPSGHAQQAATFWGYLAVRGGRAWLWAPAVLLVAVIGLSRIYLGVHFSVDVLGGIAIGLAVLAAALLGDRFLVPWLATWPRWALAVAGIGLPLGVELALPAHNTGMVLGGLAAVLTAPLAVVHRVPDPWRRRVAVAGLGLAVTAACWALTGVAAAPLEERPLVDFARYLLVGWVGLGLGPYLARRVGLAPRAGE